MDNDIETCWPPAYRTVTEWTDEHEALLQERIRDAKALGYTSAPATCEELVRSTIVKDTIVPKEWRDTIYFSMMLSSALVQDICVRIIEMEARHG